MAKSPTVNFAILFYLLCLQFAFASFGTLVGYNPPRHPCKAIVDFRLLGENLAFGSKSTEHFKFIEK